MRMRERTSCFITSCFQDHGYGAANQAWWEALDYCVRRSEPYSEGMGLETNRRWLLVIIAGAFVIRVGWGLAQPPTIDQRLPDQAEYFSLAQNLLREHALKFYDDRFGDEVYAFRTPGYPLFLAACGANVRLARVAQAGLDASTALAIY